jgi:hypothetical protein
MMTTRQLILALFPLTGDVVAFASSDAISGAGLTLADLLHCRKAAISSAGNPERMSARLLEFSLRFGVNFATLGPLDELGRLDTINERLFLPYWNARMARWRGGRRQGESGDNFEPAVAGSSSSSSSDAEAEEVIEVGQREVGLVRSLSGLPPAGEGEPAGFDERRAEGVLASLNKSFLESTQEAVPSARGVPALPTMDTHAPAASPPTTAPRRKRKRPTGSAGTARGTAPSDVAVPALTTDTSTTSGLLSALSKGEVTDRAAMKGLLRPASFRTLDSGSFRFDIFPSADRLDEVRKYLAKHRPLPPAMAALDPATSVSLRVHTA